VERFHILLAFKPNVKKTPPPAPPLPSPPLLPLPTSNLERLSSYSTAAYFIFSQILNPAASSISYSWYALVHIFENAVHV
jgi:hypothetical protein